MKSLGKIKENEVIPLSFESILPFGKYKGLKVEDVLGKDFNYIIWTVENTSILYAEPVLRMVKARTEELFNDVLIGEYIADFKKNI